MTSTLKRTGVNSYTATLAMKNDLASWTKPTLLLHFVEQSQASTVFVVTDAARVQFQACECFRIYQVDVPGKCVRHAPGQQKYGVKATYEVILKFPCAKLQLSKEAWPFAFPYNFSVWSSLNQAAPRSHIDLLGTVLETPARDLNGTLPKLIVQLGNGDMKQEISLLGAHASTSLSKGDTVVVAGLTVCEYAGERSLQTTFLSVLEVNASLSQVKTKAQDPLREGPKRKANRLMPRATITVSDAENITQQQLRDAQASDSVPATDFTIIGTLSQLTDDFFEEDPPILATESKDVMCWKTHLQDQTGQIQVKIWDKACYELLQLTANKMRGLWEAGHEDHERRQEILDILNAQLGFPVTCSCKASVWSYGHKEKHHEAQINVNSIEVQLSTE